MEKQCIYCGSMLTGNEPRIYLSKENYAHDKCYNQFHKNDENVNHPSHYGGKENPFEVIKIIEHHELGFCLGNTLKYILRAGKKDSQKYIEDLEKAQWYLERKINNLKQKQNA